MVVVPGPNGWPRPNADAAPHPRIVLVDRQPLMSAAIAQLLAGAPLCAEVRTTQRSDTALQLLDEAPADLVLCDIKLTPLEAAKFVEVVTSRKPPAAVVLMADPDDESLLLDVISSRASGFFTKNASLPEFLDGVQAVLDGHRAVGDNLMRRLVSRTAGWSDPGVRAEHRLLSPTELEILTQIGEAKRVSDIAAAKGISEKTVRNHLGSIYRKLHLRGRTEAVLQAARMGLTEV
jgi:DNA-binding NarL/FixJ family response regulator